MFLHTAQNRRAIYLHFTMPNEHIKHATKVQSEATKQRRIYNTKAKGKTKKTTN